MGGYILVVEDDEALREALSLELSRRGYEVRGAGHGVEALRLVGEELPLLILTDLEMPVMNGRQMLQQLRQDARARHVPVLVLSAFGFEWEAELMGAQGYLRKPVRAAQLDEAMARALGMPSEAAILH